MRERAGRPTKTPTRWQVNLLALIALCIPVSPDRAGLVGGLVACLVLAEHFSRTRPQLVDYASIALVALIAASWLWAVYPTEALRGAVLLTPTVLIFFAVRRALRTAAEWRRVAAGYVVGCIVAVGWTVVAHRGELGTGDRLGLSFNVNTLAFSLVIGLVLIAALWRQDSPPRHRLWLATAVLPLGIWLTGTRSALLAAALLGAWVLLSRLSPRLMATGAAVGVAFLAYQIATGDVEELLGLEGSRATGDLSGRFGLWERARGIWAEHPWLGMGAGGFRMTNHDHIAVHNEILEFGAGLGIVGVLLFLVWLYAALGPATRGADPRGRAMLVGGYIVAMAPLMLSGVWFAQQSTWLSLALVSQMALVLPRGHDKRIL